MNNFQKNQTIKNITKKSKISEKIFFLKKKKLQKKTFLKK